MIVDAFHHLPDPEAVLGDVARVLRPGGVLVVQEFDPGTLRGRLLEAGEAAFGLDSQFYTREDLATLLAEAGFEVSIVAGGFTYTLAGTKPGG
jgi:demethylmenaquinone methyltransferase/2-methoxy-6-polyprenyl-1,4-benzoquinol methylase